MFITVAVVLIAIAIWQYLRARNDIFKRLDIVGPPPTILLGNLPDINKDETLRHPLVLASGELLKKWTSQYGKVYGYFEGGIPIMVISDPDMLSEIFVKQFSNFHGRKVMIGDVGTADLNNMFFSVGARWKRLRNISNPTFTSLKMKQMYPIISECVDELMHVIDESYKIGKPFNIHTAFKGCTFDVFARTAFGYQTSCQTNRNDKFFDIILTLLGGAKLKTAASRIFVFTSTILPELRSLIVFPILMTGRLRQHPYLLTTDHMKKVIEARRKQKDVYEGRKDLIQLLLEAEATADDFDPLAEKVESMQNLNIEKKMTTDEIVSQCIIFMLAGYETTSNTLAFVAYHMALYPDVQEKLYQEIKDNIPEVKDISYDVLKKLRYMDMVINETLRIYPIGQPSMHRRCMKACKINDIYIPEDMTVVVDVLSLHLSEEHWGPDAAEFNPERFSPENSRDRHPSVYLPFGSGPRACIGKRLAFLEMRLVLCKLMLKYKILTTDQLQVPVRVEQLPISRSPEHGIVIKLEKRN